MKKTLSNARKNTKNFARNLGAGIPLATTVSATDLVENLTTTVTRPTANILKTVENTSEAIGNTFKNTAKGNILHTAGNLITTPVRAVASAAEGSIKGVGHSLQYFSGANQIGNNAYITTGESGNQLLSTSDASPDIPHKEIHLKEATDLGRNGEHLLAGKDHKASSSKVLRRMSNVKNSVVNIPMNVLRTGTDLISATAQRARGVVESIGGIPKDIKSSRSGVFTKGQSFGTKFKKVFTDGIRGSVKSVGKGVLNIANEGVLKSGAAVVGTAGNFLGRLRGNTLRPLFSTKPAEEQVDNSLEKTSRFQKLQSYYTSTPREKNEKKEEGKKEGEKNEDLSADKAEEKSEQEEEKAEAKEEKAEEKAQKKLDKEDKEKKERERLEKSLKEKPLERNSKETKSPAPANETPVAPKKDEKKETEKKEGEEAKNEKESAAPKKEAPDSKKEDVKKDTPSKGEKPKEEKNSPPQENTETKNEKKEETANKKEDNKEEAKGSKEEAKNTKATEEIADKKEDNTSQKETAEKK